jgi:hypothetical protein
MIQAAASSSCWPGITLQLPGLIPAVSVAA